MESILSLSKSSKVLTEGLHFEKVQLIDFPLAVQDYHAGCVHFAPDLSLLRSPLVRVSLFSFLFSVDRSTLSFCCTIHASDFGEDVNRSYLTQSPSSSVVVVLDFFSLFWLLLVPLRRRRPLLLSCFWSLAVSLLHQKE
jgi:hypothetical protein